MVQLNDTKICDYISVQIILYHQNILVSQILYLDQCNISNFNYKRLNNYFKHVFLLQPILFPIHSIV